MFRIGKDRFKHRPRLLFCAANKLALNMSFGPSQKR
jgi:hypothetical protein